MGIKASLIYPKKERKKERKNERKKEGKKEYVGLKVNFVQMFECPAFKIF